MRKIVLLGALLITSMMSAQDMDVVKGDFDFLKDQKEINIEFDYSKLTLLKENKTEAAYVVDRAKELNDKNKGVGDIWKKKWAGAKETIWQPKFLELVNIVLAKKKKELSFQEGLTSAKYTLIVESVWIFPGWDAMVMKQPAKVTTNLKFVETANRSNVLLEITSENEPGDQYGNNFSNESRIGEGFAKTGKSLAGQILKKLK
ncbi:MAG: hypothetical protein ABI426_11035 [Flavobacterium sp.]